MIEKGCRAEALEIMPPAWAFRATMDPLFLFVRLKGTHDQSTSDPPTTMTRTIEHGSIAMVKKFAVQLDVHKSAQEAHIQNWIAKLPSEISSATAASDLRSIPPLASSPDSEEISTQIRKRKWCKTEQDPADQKGAHPQKRYLRRMDQDTVSFTGSNPSLISSRPILEAKSPSRRSSRSTSPTRSTLARLRSAAPPIDICQPGPAATASPSEAVNKLKGFLLTGYDKAFIPRQLEVCTFAHFSIQSLLHLTGPIARNRSGRSYCPARRNVLR